MTLEDRFYSKVNKLGVKAKYCWEWTASTDSHGYGQFAFDGKMRRAHRISYMIRCGDIPKDMCVLHKCDNSLCVRPSHLFLGTLKDNMQDMVAKGRAPDYKGENHNRSKLKDKEVLEIRDLSKLGANAKSLAEHFGVSISCIVHILDRYTWKHI